MEKGVLYKMLHALDYTHERGPVGAKCATYQRHPAVGGELQLKPRTSKRLQQTWRIRTALAQEDVLYKLMQV